MTLLDPIARPQLLGLFSSEKKHLTTEARRHGEKPGTEAWLPQSCGPGYAEQGKDEISSKVCVLGSRDAAKTSHDPGRVIRRSDSLEWQALGLAFLRASASPR
jgi:hypothetical protein